MLVVEKEAIVDAVDRTVGMYREVQREQVKTDIVDFCTRGPLIELVSLGHVGSA